MPSFEGTCAHGFESEVGLVCFIDHKAPPLDVTVDHRQIQMVHCSSDELEISVLSNVYPGLDESADLLISSVFIGTAPAEKIRDPKPTNFMRPVAGCNGRFFTFSITFVRSAY